MQNRRHAKVLAHPQNILRWAIQVCPDLGETFILVSAPGETSWIQSFITVPVKCVMYVNPSGTGRRSSTFWRGRVMHYEGMTQERKQGGEKNWKEIWQGKRRHWENDRNVTGTGRQTANRGDKHRARIDRWKDKGTFILQLKNLPFWLFLIWCFLVTVMRRATWHLMFSLFFPGMNPGITDNQTLIHMAGMQRDSTATTIPLKYVIHLGGMT